MNKLEDSPLYDVISPYIGKEVTVTFEKTNVGVLSIFESKNGSEGWKVSRMQRSFFPNKQKESCVIFSPEMIVGVNVTPDDRLHIYLF